VTTERPRLLRVTVRVGVGVALGGVAIVLAFLVNRALGDIPFQHLVRDPGHVTGTSPWIGALAFAGWFGWVAAAVLLLTGGWLRRRADRADRRAQFLFVTGCLTLGVLLDDTYQLHEDVLPDATGIGEEGWYVFYVVVLVAWIGLYRRELRTAPVELAVAAVLLGASQLIDAVEATRDVLETGAARAVIWEEGLKLIGIGFFTAFAVIEVGRAVVRLELAAGDPSGGAGRP